MLINEEKNNLPAFGNKIQQRVRKTKRCICVDVYLPNLHHDIKSAFNILLQYASTYCNLELKQIIGFKSQYGLNKQSHNRLCLLCLLAFESENS